MTKNSNLSLTAKALPWFICTLGAIFYCYAYFLRVSPSVMVHELRHHFHISATLFGNLAAFYYYAYTPMQLAVGIIIDRFGAKLVLSGASLLCTLGVFTFVSAHNLPMAELGRFIIGFGSAFAYVTVLKLATVWLPPNRFAIVAGSTTALGMLAAICSDLLLTHIVQAVGYKNSLYCTALVGIILCVIIFFTVSNKPKNPVNNAEPEKTTFKTLLKTMGHMLTNKQMWVIGLVGLFLYMPASVYTDVWGIAYLESVRHLTAEQAARVISMIFVGWIISSPIIGAISDKIQLRKLPLFLCSFGAAVTLITVFYAPFITQNMLYPMFLLFGMFCGVHPLCFALSRENYSNAVSGTAVAVTNTLIMLGGMIFQPVVGILLDFHWSHSALHQLVNHTRHYSYSDYQFALTVLPIALVLSTCLIPFIKETYCQIKVTNSLQKAPKNGCRENRDPLVTQSN